MQDKKVRVSADTSPLDGLRRDVKDIWNEFSQLEKGFGGLAKETLEVIQKQIDLLKERNSLLGEGNEYFQIRNYVGEREDNNIYNRRGFSSQNIPPIIDPLTGRISGQERDISPTEEIRTPNLDINQNSIYGKIISELVRIADILEKEDRDDTNRPIPSEEGGEGVVPPEIPNRPNTDNQPSGDFGGGFDLTKFKLPNISSLIGMLPFGAAIYGIGQLIGKQSQFNLGQYSAENEFQRENNWGNHWLMNALTFGISGTEAQKAEIGRMYAERNDKVLNQFASLHNYSYNQALAKQLEQSFGDNASKISDLKNDNISNYELSTSPYMPTGMAPGLFINYTGERDKIEKEAEESGITAEEYHTWASRNLGLNITDYIEKVVNLQKAGVYERNTSLDDINQLLLAERIRGISIDEMMPALRATRFSENMTGSQVVRTFDTNLQGLGKSDQYIASTLGEYLSSFQRNVERVLEKTGTVDTRSIVGAMTSIQNATRTEGRQLERYQGALMGQDISQDDTTQALLLRTARRLNPGGNLSDLQAMIETMPEDTELQKEFFSQIKEMTGGGEMMRQVMKAIFPTLSMKDIIDLENATGNEADVIWGKMRTSGGRYSEANAQSKVGAAEMSTAGTTNRKIVDGYDKILEQQGTSLKEVLDKVYSDPIPVMIVSGRGSNDESQNSILVEDSQLVKMLIQSMDNLRVGIKDMKIEWEE